MKMPKLKDYDVKVLIILGNQTKDEINRDYIKNILINKFFSLNYSILYLLNQFAKSSGIMHEVYAEIIMRIVCQRKLYLSPQIMDIVISLVSMDTLTEYGMKCDDIEINEKCKNEFWNRALDDDKYENLIRKKYK